MQMIKKLPEWYRACSLVLQEELLLKRCEAISRIHKGRKLDYFLDCIRLYLGKRIDRPEFKNELIEDFREYDLLFPQKNNDVELRVLAGAIISEYTGDLELMVRMGLITGSFQSNTIINEDILDAAKKYLTTQSVRLREVDFEPMDFDNVLEEQEEEDLEYRVAMLEDAVKAFTSPISNYLQTLKSKIQVLEEESNIHWWLFRGYSNTCGKRFGDIEAETVPILAAKELGDLTKIVPGPRPAKQFLAKQMDSPKTVSTGNLDIKNVINALDEQFIEKSLTSEKVMKLGNLTPILAACLKRKELGEGDGWELALERSMGVHFKCEVDRLELAYQAYIEYLFAKSINTWAE